MALPADKSGAKTPGVRAMRIAPALAPAARLILAMLAAETELSAVPTTRWDAASRHPAVPATPERSTASLTEASWPALTCAGAAAAAGVANRPTAATPIASANSRIGRDLMVSSSWVREHTSPIGSDERCPEYQET